MQVLDAGWRSASCGRPARACARHWTGWTVAESRQPQNLAPVKLASVWPGGSDCASRPPLRGCRFRRPTSGCSARARASGWPGKSSWPWPGFQWRFAAWTIPVGGTFAAGAALFFVPDIVTRVTAANRRTDFRYALTSYLDLVTLERGAGAGPTEALEAAAEVGKGWAFALIAASLDQARGASRPPWDGLAQLAADTGIVELADVADIAGVAGEEGARILDTLSARAESMRVEALAAARARSSSRSTTMVLPIAMLSGGFLVLLIFPDLYRLFG